LPAIATLRDGGFMLIARVTEDKVLVHSPLGRPAFMSRAELMELWDGGLILMTRRAGLSDVTRRFDITWFLGAIHKYRYLLSEVLLASFFLQLFALVSPLFFQVVIDKVLVHRAVSTLDVLVVGLLAISTFETVLGRFCCKSLFAFVITISFGCTRDFRVNMWGTSLPEDKLAGDLGNVI
jgi:ATP-binding cassette, subfamily B, bacterial HlyB/CyaB